MVVFQHQQESMSKSFWETLLDSLHADSFSFLEVVKDGFCFLCRNKLIYGTCLSSWDFLPHALCGIHLHILHLDWVN